MCPSLAVTTDDGADNDAGFMNPQQWLQLHNLLV